MNDSREYHPLLNGIEFREELAGLGVKKPVRGALYNLLCREYIGKDKVRGGAESVAYRELCCDTGVVGDVISIPNMVQAQDEIRALPGIRPSHEAALQALIGHYLQPELPFPIEDAS